ncbi:MAG: ATP-dependent DNA helicase RecG [Patescibacteria group bacterium]
MKGNHELLTPLSEIHGIGARFLEKLARLHIYTVKDLLWHFPTRYEDFRTIYKIADLIPNQEATIQGVVEKIKSRHTWRRNLFLMEADISDDTGTIRALWFNQPYIQNVLQPGKQANFSGKVVLSRKESDLYLSNPTYEVLRSGHSSFDETGAPIETPTETRHTARIVPIYPETRGFTSKGLRYLIKPILDNLPEIPETIPEEVLKGENFPTVSNALQNVHFPETLEDAIAAKRRFAFEDLFLLQLWSVRERLKFAKERAPQIHVDIAVIKNYIAALPFALTKSQKKTLWEIMQDLGRPHPMNRLLQGDVGSGKTIVAAIAALETAHTEYQTAFMAPTELLARQHYKTFQKFFRDFDGGIALLTSSEAKMQYGHQLESEMRKAALLDHIEQNKIKIVIGTHALIQKTVTFPKLGLVVVDEQHRFGVRQRDVLLKHNLGNKKEHPPIPHFLSMSATPIPRTLNLTLFGDLDLSLITELPKDRKPILTKVVPPKDRTKAYAFIRSEIKKSRQVFVICPRIEVAAENPSAFGNVNPLQEIRAVKEEYKKLSEKIFPDLRVAMLHGRMRPKEKEKTMREFSEGKKDILVATSVIEVGIDIPNATIMIIEGSERFGLAQLYQFRGRVGRGEHQSYCLLFTDASGTQIKARLKAIVEAKNGFELAEYDLKMRGPGEFLGESQTGMPDLAMKAIQNPDLVQHAREAATKLLAKDPNLKIYPLLAERLAEFQKNMHGE